MAIPKHSYAALLWHGLPSADPPQDAAAAAHMPLQRLEVPSCHWPSRTFGLRSSEDAFVKLSDLQGPFLPRRLGEQVSHDSHSVIFLAEANKKKQYPVRVSTLLKLCGTQTLIAFSTSFSRVRAAYCMLREKFRMSGLEPGFLSVATRAASKAQRDAARAARGTPSRSTASEAYRVWSPLRISWSSSVSLRR